jgi:hypothetical protein
MFDERFLLMAVNALPALLAVAEIADQWDRATDYESREAHLARLHRALRMLPNASDYRTSEARSAAAPCSTEGQ